MACRSHKESETLNYLGAECVQLSIPAGGLENQDPSELHARL